jgi:hypothetical protein
MTSSWIDPDRALISAISGACLLVRLDVPPAGHYGLRIMTKSRILAAFLSVSLAGTVAACSSNEGTERWATTENTNVDINWDKVNEAYKTAEGPEDLEKKINEIYEGDEIISVHVKDDDAKNQVVTGFFDKNKSGSIDEGEKIFTIKRTITGDGTGEMSTQGHGHYAGYHSPMLSIMTGMMLGSMMSNAFSPRYVPMYSQPYTTTAARAGSIANTRSSYRASNPERFNKSSRTGRSYGGSRPSRPSSVPRSRGGGFFGGVTATRRLDA